MFQFPGNIEEMKMIAKQFQNKWQFPNCLGSVDGKHVKIVPPPGAGSHFFNYKGFHSIVLMAIVDADYQFIYVDVGINGRVSDGGVLKKTEFYKRLNEGALNIPPPEKTTQDSDPLPFVYIGDEAFALRPDFLKPYPQRKLSDHDKRIYNYRVCRARRIVENAFGILAARFQIFHSAINFQSVEDISFVVLACCTLHNYLCKSRRDYITPDDSDTENHITGTIQEGLSPGGFLEPIHVTRTGNSSNNAKKAREDFVKYFNTSGVVPWQERMINS